MIDAKDKRYARLKRKKRVRKKFAGTPERPRLTVYKSARHIYAQIVDDVGGVTLASASTQAKGLRERLPRGGDKKAAAVVGEALAKQALSVGIKCVCFDRNRYKFHGRIKALADGARKAGLVF